MLKHNEITYNQVKSFIENGQDCCVVNPCGSGKSIILENIIKDNQDKHILVITKQANAFDYYKSMSSLFNDIEIMTYNKLLNIYKSDKISSISGVDICVIDEAHYMGAYKWSEAIKALRDESNCITVGLTATPQRREDQGTENSIVSEFNNNVAGNYTVTELQHDDVFVEPEYIVSLASVEDDAKILYEQIAESDLSEAKKEAYNKKLDDGIEDWKENYSPAVVIRDNLPKFLYKESGNKILVFCSRIDTIDKDEKFIMSLLRKQFPNKKLKSYIYTSKSSEDALSDFLNNTSNYINVLFSINKVCETVHIPDLNIMFFLRKTDSNRVITQQLGRLNNLNNKNKGLVIDMVNNVIRYKQPNRNFSYTVREEVHIQYKCYKPNINYISKTRHIFQTIDKTTRVQIYTYKGFRGTLPQVCYVFRKNAHDVQDYLSQEYPFEEAISLARSNYSRDWINLADVDFDSYELDFKLTDEENEVVMRFLPLISHIADLRLCKDEEILSNCKLYLCYTVHNYFSERQKTGLYCFIYNNLSRFMLSQIRLSFDRKNNIRSIEDYDAVYTIRDYTKDGLRESIKRVISDLTDREKFIVINNYGLQNLGIDVGEYSQYDIPSDVSCMTLTALAELTNYSRERIRQINKKAIRILKHPRRAKYLRPYYEEFCS